MTVHGEQQRPGAQHRRLTLHSPRLAEHRGSTQDFAHQKADLEGALEQGLKLYVAVYSSMSNVASVEARENQIFESLQDTTFTNEAKKAEKVAS